jgi:hypothetical protein
MKHRRVTFSFLLLTGCAGLIGVPDLSFDEKAQQGGSANGNVEGGASSSGGSSGSSGGDGAAPVCDQTKTQTDKANCGRCGHDCGGGDCVNGECKAFEIAEISNAPLTHIVEHGNSLYVSTSTTLTTQYGGIWKLPKTTGNAQKYVDIGDARAMAILGDTLYFVVYDDIFDDAGKYGGLWSCDLNGPTPCVPKLVAAAGSPDAISQNGGSIYYGDNGTNNALMQLTPPGAPVIFRPGFGFTYNLFVDGQSAYYAYTLFASPQHANLFEIYPDAGDVTVLSTYEKANVAQAGVVVGTPTALYFSAYDDSKSTGGVMRRVSRPGTAGAEPCDFGGTSNKRPYGVYVDDSRVYWTNQGDFTEPYANGSVAYCDTAGCCTAPKTAWTGDGEPSPITGDATALYWATYRTGKVWKVAKP